jgi:type III secretion protein D
MLQLRVLSGHHKGAILDLDETQQNLYTVGCDDYSDVLLVDIGIKKQHLKLTYENHQWFLETEEDVREENGCFVIGKQLIHLYKRFYIVGIWVGFAEPEDEWNILEPLPELDFLNQANINLDAFLKEDPKKEEITTPIIIEQQRTSLKTKILGVMGLLSLAGWATANVFLGEPTQLTQNMQNANLKNIQKADAKDPMPQRIQQNFSRRELAKMLETRLTALDLNQHIDYEYNPDGWVLRVSLDEEERMRLERAIQQFNQDHQPKFAITVQNIEKTHRLGIEISQVILGKIAGVVTKTGERLYIGDEYNGYRLISVAQNKVVFDGPEKVEIMP